MNPTTTRRLPRSSGLAALALAILAWPLPAVATDEGAEPPLAMTLTVDGRPFSVQLGEATVLPGTFTDPKVELSAAATRHFDRAGVVFDYPAHFTWDADIEGDDYRSWIISGNDSKIMLFALGNEFTPEGYSSGIAEQFGPGKTKIGPIRRQFGKTRFDGIRIEAQVAEDVGFVQDCFGLPESRGVWRMLILQDVAPEIDPDLDEPPQVLEMLERTFRTRQ